MREPNPTNDKKIARLRWRVAFFIIGLGASVIGLIEGTLVQIPRSGSLLPLIFGYFVWLFVAAFVFCAMTANAGGLLW